MKASYFYVKRPAKKKPSCIYRDFLFFYHERSGASALLGFVIMFQSYYYITLFVSFFYIAMSLGNLFQRRVPIYDRFYLSRLNKLFEKD